MRSGAARRHREVGYHALEGHCVPLQRILRLTELSVGVVSARTIGAPRAFFRVRLEYPPCSAGRGL